MEQEVQVTIHSNQPNNLEEEHPRETLVRDHVKEIISETLSEAFASFRKSESYEQILQNVEKTREYIKKNPSHALLYSLAAGALVGLFLKRKR